MSSTDRPTTAATLGQAQAEMHVERQHVGIFRSLFRRAKRLVAAFRDSVVAFTRGAWRSARSLVKTVTGTAAGKAVLSGVGMVYMGQLAVGSARFLAYSTGVGWAYVWSQIISLGFLVFGAAWFLQFGSQMWNALAASPRLTPTESA